MSALPITVAPLTTEERLARLEKERTWATILAIGLLGWQIWDHMRITELSERK